jgi:hypothetical protein
MKINHAQLLAMVTNGDKRYFYTRLVFEDFSHRDVKVDLYDLQKLGVAKTIRSDRRVSEWYETEQGLKWLENKFMNGERKVKVIAKDNYKYDEYSYTNWIEGNEYDCVDKGHTIEIADERGHVFHFTGKAKDSLDQCFIFVQSE